MSGELVAGFLPGDEEAEYTVTGLFANHGSIAQFSAVDSEGRSCIVACDHRPAQAIAQALSEDGEVPGVWAPSYMVQYRLVDGD